MRCRTTCQDSILPRWLRSWRRPVLARVSVQHLAGQRVDLHLLLFHQELGEQPVDLGFGASVGTAVSLGRPGWFHMPSKVNVREQSRTISLLTALGRLRDRLYEGWIELGTAVVREESVLLLLDVGQLRVAEAFDRSRLHQALDEAAVDLQKLDGVPDLGVAPATRPRHLQAAELRDQERLPPVRGPGVVRLVPAGPALEDAPGTAGAPCEIVRPGAGWRGLTS